MGNRVTVRVVDSVVGLTRGSEMTVEVTDVVRRRVAKGIYKVVDDHRAGAHVHVAMPADVDEPPSDEPPPPPASVQELYPDEPPAGNASKDEWLSFLARQGIDVPLDEEGETPGRDGLKMLWQQVTGGS
ncbi:Uncharacterised protein [Mycolicibacterium vanbaalenii]|uniref:Uncharacterized protein n=1 Tax=Mycolicibacterium vanbaalenii TaxID=110539 RepID=A0A5S9RA14_MYCVN|nr:Uncharacterised protein [Mycolicibacterium vanbaalenii]